MFVVCKKRAGDCPRRLHQMAPGIHVLEFRGVRLELKRPFGILLDVALPRNVCGFSTASWTSSISIVSIRSVFPLRA